MDSLIINRSTIEKHLHATDLAPIFRDGFVHHSSLTPTERNAQRCGADLSDGNTAMVVFPGRLPSIPAYTVKVHAKFPANTANDQAAIQGCILLHDSRNGNLLAVMESAYITAVRTGLCAALATHELAPGSATRAAVIGAGVQGRQQLRHLLKLRPVSDITVYDIVPENAVRFVQWCKDELAVSATVAPSVKPCVADADLILMATWSRQPILLPDMLKPGAHITSLGCDQQGKQEVDRAVLSQATVITDDKPLALQSGIAANNRYKPEYQPFLIAGELGEVFAGKLTKAKDSNSTFTVYAPLGLPFQDLILAWEIYRRIKENGDSPSFDFCG